MATISNTTNESINYHIDRLFATVTLVHIIIGTISIVGNGLVMFVTVHNYRRMNPFKWLIVHLAFCDLLFAVLMFVDLPHWKSGEWIYGKELCKVIPPFLLLTGLAAYGTIIIIACERYRGISNPLAKRWRIKYISFALLLIWAFQS